IALSKLNVEEGTMRILIADDESSSRCLLRLMLTPYGTCDLAVNGLEAVAFFRKALESGQPYDLVCLDIMMPEMNGQVALKQIRDLERKAGINSDEESKIIMISCLDSPSAVIEAYYRGGCTSYLVKPCSRTKLLDTLRDFNLIQQYV
ncbi:MAG: response regulator, partial [Desulfuromonadaceae bacterium]